jgi:hypothetical protein
MCPGTFFLQLAILGIILVSIYGYRRMGEMVGLNFDTLSRILEAPVVNSRFLQPSLEGYYKGRKVILSYLFLAPYNNFVNPHIEPRAILRKQNFFCLDYPSITEHTTLKGKRIGYNCRRPFGTIEKSNFSWGNIRVYSEEEFRAILEELTQAAEIVEKPSALS